MHALCGDWDVQEPKPQTISSEGSVSRCGPLIDGPQRRFALAGLALSLVATMAVFFCIRAERVGPQLLTIQQQGSQVLELGAGAFPRRRGMHKVASCSQPCTLSYEP
jgi:hypothetical protein